MSSKHFLITLLFVAFQVANGQDRGECIDDTQEHIQFLKDFYTEYLSRPDVTNHENRMNLLRKYNTSELIDTIMEMWKNMELDYDPFIFAQDILPKIVLNHIKIEKYEKQKNIYLMSYPHDFHVEVGIKYIKLEVMNTDEGYKISDIISVYGPEVGLHFPLGR